MTRVFHLFCVSATVLLCCSGIASSARAQEQIPVIAQDLNKARASGKLGAVLWTRRADVCTLQLVIKVPNVLSSGGRPVSLPRIQVWLLKPDGSTVPWSQVINPDKSKIGGRTIALDMMYRYPLSASQDAVAAAIMVDDQYYVEPLKLKD